MNEATSADSAVLASMPEIPHVEVTDQFTRDPPPTPHYHVEPLNAESFAISSDLLPEDETPADAMNIEATSPKKRRKPKSPPTRTAKPSKTAPKRAKGETRGRGRSNDRSFHRRYRIQEVIKRNQIVLIQVIKEERGNKGASLTTFISLAGRAAVLMPNSPKGGGISRKITDRETRKRLKEVASEMRTHRGMSVIIRTAGIDRTKAEIRRDYEYLVKLWNDIRTQTLASTAPALIYEEGNLIKRSLRDLYTSDVEEVLVEGEEAFTEAKNFMTMLMPSHAARVKHYHGSMPLFSYNRRRGPACRDDRAAGAPALRRLPRDPPDRGADLDRRQLRPLHHRAQMSRKPQLKPTSKLPPKWAASSACAIWPG